MGTNIVYVLFNLDDFGSMVAPQKAKAHYVNNDKRFFKSKFMFERVKMNYIWSSFLVYIINSN